MDEEEAPRATRVGGDAITQAFTEFRSALMRLVGRIVNPHSIEDIVQETFIRAYEASRRQTINHPRSFMWKTAKNLALNHVENHNNKLATHVADFGDPGVSLPAEITEADLELEFESRERFLVFCRAVQRLPLQCRRVFILKKVYGLPQKEIAARLNISESTVEKQAAKGLFVCAEFMAEMGYPVEEGRQRKHDNARVSTNK